MKSFIINGFFLFLSFTVSIGIAISIVSKH